MAGVAYMEDWRKRRMVVLETPMLAADSECGTIIFVNPEGFNDVRFLTN